MHIHPRFVFRNPCKPHFFHYAFRAKRNTRCCALFGNILKKKKIEEKSSKRRKERGKGWDRTLK
jgi:hypothetical protein